MINIFFIYKLPYKAVSESGRQIFKMTMIYQKIIRQILYVYLKMCSIPNIKKQEVLNSSARSAITAPQTFNNVGLPLAILYDYDHLFRRVSAVKGKDNIIKT